MCIRDSVNEDAIDALTRQATAFLALNQRKRRNAVCNVLEFEKVADVLGDGADGPPEPAPKYIVGTSDGVKRRVCECVFLAHCPVSPSVLRNIVSQKRNGKALFPGTEPVRNDKRVTAGTGRISAKTAHIVA
eukprot:4239383-Pleurochrysis_carterae.AAC.1